jgi:sugar lactone lactonase YvrE
VKISRVETEACLVGESALWDPAGQALFYLDIVGRKVHRHDPATGETRTWATPTSCGALALRKGGGAVVAQADGIHALDLATGGFERLAALEGTHPRARFNDGRTDRQGRFVLGLSDSSFEDTQAIGGIYSLGTDHALRRLDGDICFSNSPCFSPDGRTFYFADSHAYAVYVYDYDPATGGLGERRPFVDTRPLGGMPDGATVDADGLIWMAIFRAGKIAAFRPDGAVERLVEVPVSQVSSVNFGGPGLGQLYFTSLDTSYFGDPPEDGAGAVFRIDGLGARGIAETPYGG